MDPVAGAALVTALSGLILGVMAEAGRRKAQTQQEQIERASVSREDFDAALEAWKSLLEPLRQENGRLQAEVQAANAKASEALAAHADCEANVANLERRLHLTEARIAELGG